VSHVPRRRIVGVVEDIVMFLRFCGGVGLLGWILRMLKDEMNAKG
jgi:hypothetical protein